MTPKNKWDEITVYEGISSKVVTMCSRPTMKPFQYQIFLVSQPKTVSPLLFVCENCCSLSPIDLSEVEK